mgnify:CR=1 FL=1
MKQFHGKKSDVMVKVPQSVAKEALEGLELIRLGYKGGVETGKKRAVQLYTKDKISIEDLKFMRNWYARHFYTSGPGYKKWVSSGKNTKKFKKDELRGLVAIKIWGGKSGFNWVFSDKNTNLLEKYFNKKFSGKPGEL